MKKRCSRRLKARERDWGRGAAWQWEDGMEGVAGKREEGIKRVRVAAWHPNSEKEKDMGVPELAQVSSFVLVPRHVHHAGSCNERC